MRRLLTLLVLCVLAQPASALPAPMSDAELFETSDLVALVRVISVTCTGVREDPTTGERLPSYLAKLRVIEAKKGGVRPGGEVLVTFRAIPTGLLGPWTVYYYPGEEVWTHLVKQEGGATYTSTWWNAKTEEVKAPETKDLPTEIGESVFASE